MCEEIFDCNVTGQICFANPTFADASVCECSSWYGWIGPECDEASGQLIFSGINLNFFLIWGLILCFLNMRTIHFLIKYSSITAKNNRYKTGAILATVVFGFLSSVSVVLNMSIRLAGVYDHTNFRVLEYPSLFSDTSFDTSVKGGQAAGSFLLLAVLFYMICSLVIISSWMNLLTSLDKFFPPLLKISETTLKRIIQALVAVSLIFFIILTALRLIFEASVLIVLLVLIDIGIYGIAYYRVYTKYKSYKKSGVKTGLLDNAVTLIRTCARVNICCTLLLIIFLGIYSANVNVYDELLAPGDFNYIVFSLDIVVFFAMVMLSYTCYYAHTVATKFIKRDTSWVPMVGGLVRGLSRKNNSQLDIVKSQNEASDIPSASFEEVS